MAPLWIELLQIIPVVAVAYAAIDILLFIGFMIETPLARLAMWMVIRDMDKQEKKERVS